MDRVSHRLAARLPAFFDTRPEAVLALRVQHPEGAHWHLADETLTLSAGAALAVIPLDGHTLASLADAIELAGFSVAYSNPGIAHLSALILLDGAGDQSASNGDHLYAFSTVLAALLHALGGEFGHAREAVTAALAQLILPQSTQEWADLFGRMFDVPRMSGEADGVYTQRILIEVRRARSNPVTIAENIRRLTGITVQVREPWKEIFALSVNALSGQHHLQGAPIYEYHRFHLESDVGIDWSQIESIADADRPAGTLRLPSAVRLAPLHAVREQTQVHAGSVLIRSSWWRFVAPGALSDDLSLSSMVAGTKTAIGAVRINGLATFGLRGPYGDDNPWQGLWDARVWRYGETPLEFYPPRELSLLEDPSLLHTADGSLVRTQDGRYVLLSS